MILALLFQNFVLHLECVRLCVHACEETLPVLLTEIKFQKDQKYTRQSC